MKNLQNKDLADFQEKKRRNRKASLSESEIMTILLYFYFNTFRNFKHYYLYFIKIHLKKKFPNAVSYNRFVEFEKRVLFKLMSLWDKIMLRKRYIIECVNDILKNKAQLVHSRHRSLNNFLVNMVALGAYCFFHNKPQAL